MHNWRKYLGTLLVLFSILAPIVVLEAGWGFGIAVVTLPLALLHGQMELEEWLVAAYGLWMLCYFVIGLFVMSNRQVYPAFIVATVATYLGLGLWLTFGDLPWVNMLNGGSLQYGLFFGKHEIFQGDFSRYIDPRIWGVKFGLLTLLFTAILVLLVKKRHAFLRVDR